MKAATAAKEQTRRIAVNQNFEKMLLQLSRATIWDTEYEKRSRPLFSSPFVARCPYRRTLSYYPSCLFLYRFAYLPLSPWLCTLLDGIRDDLRLQ